MLTHLGAGLVTILQQVGAPVDGVANAPHRPEAPVLHAEHLPNQRRQTGLMVE
jgi:hypothetical protein